MKLELNEYIERFSEIKPRLDEIGEQIGIEEVVVVNDGCKNVLVNKVVAYLKGFDILVIVESKGASALNRLFG